jgi:Uncharacterized conserved protein
MNPNDFIEHDFGSLEWADNGNYCYYKPNPLLKLPELSDGTSRRFFQTIAGISRLDGRVSAMQKQERDLILSTFTLKESTTSSAIEGTRSTIGDLLKEEKEKEKDPMRAMDNQEIRNYKTALDYGLDEISSGKEITLELMLKMHSMLLDGVRGKDKRPGSFRDTSVAIGRLGDTLTTAKFVPPTVIEAEYLMKDLIKFIVEAIPNPLLKVGLTHYQFETIHPFTDGNGRIGRLLIMLILYSEDVLRHPVLYPSEYFNKNRDKYTEALYLVSAKGDFEGWFNLFLDALDSQTKRSMDLIDSLESYRTKLYEMADGDGRSSLTKVIDMLFENPYITAKDVTKNTKVYPATSYNLIETLVLKGVLREVTGKNRGRLYVADVILDMLEN